MCAFAQTRPLLIALMVTISEERLGDYSNREFIAAGSCGDLAALLFTER
jgi:hypothetical protein